MANVIVVGSGLAGLSSAFQLADQGLSVEVVESREVIGGRTSSWVMDGMPVDSGLHKFLGIYRSLPRLLEKIGLDLDEMLSWVDELAFCMSAGPSAHFTFSPYHRPLSTAWSLMVNNNFLPPAEKVKLSAMASAGVAKCLSDPAALDEISIADYALQFGVSQTTVNHFLSTSTQGALFLPAAEFSSYAVFAPIAEGVKHGLTMRIGAFRSGMTDAMMVPLREAFVGKGGVIRQSSRVTQLIFRDQRVVGVRTGDLEIHADHVVLAVPLAAAQDLTRESLPSQPWLESLLQLPTHSAVSVQLDLNEPLLSGDFTNFSDNALCCFAEQSRTTFTSTAGRFSAILYPPGRFLGLDNRDIIKEVDAAAEALNLPLRGNVQRYRVIRHHHDFYKMLPGTEKLRPRQATPLPGLSLAGDYTKQPFSASMEGAVLSGELAAEAVLAELP